LSVRSGDIITIDFPVNTTSGPANADSAPAGKLVVNGVDQATPSVTISNKATGLYKASVTLPTLTRGDCVQIRIAATIGGVPSNAYIWQDRADGIVDLLISTLRHLVHLPRGARR
jgi:hypothetical protein